MELHIYEPQYLRACAELLMRTMNAPPWNEHWTQESAEKYLGEFAAGPRFIGFTLFAGGALAGASFCHAKTWQIYDELCIDEFYIAPERQGEGLGTRLIQFIEMYAAENELRGMVLLADWHTPAHAFYIKNGFEDSSRMAFMYKKLFPQNP
jgi:GNAT superfamily N-acetyltransferase